MTLPQEGPSLIPSLREPLSAGLIAVDAEERICELSPRARHLLRLPAGLPDPAPFQALPAPLQALLRQSRQGRLDFANQVLVLPTTAEEPHTLLVTTFNLRPEAGAPALVATINDLSAARQLEQKMQLLDRLASIGTLSASMAHEIKNALVAIKTFVDLLLRHNKDAELAGVVSRELKRIDSIVSQMLRFAGPAKPTFGKVHIHEILQHALRLVQHQTEGRRIQLHYQLRAQPDTVHGDDYQLEQAFVNLLLNAVEATPTHGQIHLSTEILPPNPDGSPGQLLVELRDSGIGISEENLEKLFLPFFTTKATGTGLGLAIVQRIVRDHRGSVDVQSKPNQGTAFRLKLPLPKPAAS